MSPPAVLRLVGVWLLVPLRLVDGLVFLGEDLSFLIFQRRRVRRRIAQLIESHGAASAPGRQPAD